MATSNRDEAIEHDSGEPAGRSFRCQILVERDDQGIYSAVVGNLPGVGSCGATEEEALMRVREAIIGTLESYADSAMDIPWTAPVASGELGDSCQHWIVVHA
jgi:predicted RNase H-like HicB family nuclease